MKRLCIITKFAQFAQFAATAISLAAIAQPSLPAPPAHPLSTVAERSRFLQTGRYDEVIALCKAYAKTYPAAVRCFNFGRTPEGRPMLALIATRSGAFTAAAARQRAIPVLLIQGGIHAGEIDGKDAGFLALREMLDAGKRGATGPLDRQVLIFVPVFNVDGHERFGKWNRPNQRGPEEMGWRTTAQNYNLNRDYAKAETPEMQAMLRLVNEWDPLVTVDLHVTDGAKFEHDIAIMVEPVNGGDVELRQAGRSLREAVVADLARAGSLPVNFYPSFAVSDDPASGFIDGVSPPRFSTGYFLTRNRFGMLVETHSWKPYPARVKATHDTVVSVVNQVAANGAAWLRAAKNADARAAAVAGKPVALTWKTTEKTRAIEFRGYEYTRTMSEISGALMTRYDETRPKVWKLNLRDEIVPDVSVVAPGAGYLVPAAHAALMAEKLSRHSIAFRTLTRPVNNAALETFRADTAIFSTMAIEGNQPVTLAGGWKAETRAVERGSLFVPIAQAKSLLVMALLEPLAPDSLAAWGKFNLAFERREYMEHYVAEEVARAQLAADPSLAETFRKKIESDAAFARDPSARLDYFYRRHSSWDDHFNLYPVMRIAVVPE